MRITVYTQTSNKVKVVRFSGYSYGEDGDSGILHITYYYRRVIIFVETPMANRSIHALCLGICGLHLQKYVVERIAMTRPYRLIITI